MHTVMDLHFSQVAREYRGLRTTDSEPIDYILSKLNGEKKLVGADVGCGAGRYSSMLCQALGKRFSLFCCDKSPEMIRELEKHMQSNGIQRFTVINSSSEKIPLDNDTLDVLFTFNAIHHFSII
ncbi:MAG: class I SAM-dependent methyltransferase, partial [candidate division Zixibacteria bacterium]